MTPAEGPGGPGQHDALISAMERSMERRFEREEQARRRAGRRITNWSIFSLIYGIGLGFLLGIIAMRGHL